jgi:predicted  nucleic acid-binding Zn-ribbon protein
MTTSPLAPKLADYHRYARDLAQEKELLAGVPEEMRSLHDEYSAARAEIDALAAAAEAARHERIAREGEVADAQESLRKFQQQVPKVRNQREYGALLAEIDGAKAQQKALEEGVLDLLERTEAAQQELEAKRAGFSDLEARYAAALAEWEARKPEVAARVHDLERVVGEIKAELPRNVVTQYARLAERYQGEAVSFLTSTERAGGTILWHCSACNYHVRPQAALEIRSRGTLAQCDGCRRFLLPSPDEA